MRKASAVDARGMQLRLLRMIGFFGLLLMCAALLWSGRALAAQNPGGGCAVLDVNHRLPAGVEGL